MSNKNNVIQFEQRKSDDSLSQEEQNQLVLEFRVKANKLAKSILRKWNSRIDLNEIDSIVDLSLCEASRRFDPTMGASFMTFLYYHLKGNLIRTITTAATSNSVPVDFTEVADVELYGKGYAYRSANSIEVSEALALKEVETPQESLEKKELVTLASNACDNLDKLEKEVINRIYLKGEQVINIAKLLGYSRCHISRVKKKALEQLQKDMEFSFENPKENIHDIRHRKITRRGKRNSKTLVVKESFDYKVAAN